MKKHRLHDIVLGMVIMALVMGLAIPALATTVKTIEANYMDIKLVVDGVPITPKDANGKAIEPFIYDGTTYLPVRAIGEALGKNVKWDGETKTVYIGEIPGQVNYLVDVCPPYEKSGYTAYKSAEGKFFQMGGKQYTNGFTFYKFSNDNNSGYMIINTDGQYKTLTVDIGHEDGTGIVDTVLNVYLDGVFSQSIDLKAEDSVKTITIPLNYALQVKFTLDYRRGSPRYGFANAVLE